MSAPGYPGAASQEMESEVSQVIEDAVATVSGIEELRSISSDGSAFVIVTFNLDRNLDAAVQDVRDAVASLANRLPPGMDPPVVQKQDTDSSPIISLAVSGPRSASELYYLADRYVKNVIESARVSGRSRSPAPRIGPSHRRRCSTTCRLPIVHPASARRARPPERRGSRGRVDEGLRERTLRTLGRVPQSRDFPDLVVTTVDGTAVRFKISAKCTMTPRKSARWLD